LALEKMAQSFAVAPRKSHVANPMMAASPEVDDGDLSVIYLAREHGLTPQWRLTAKRSLVAATTPTWRATAPHAHLRRLAFAEVLETSFVG
jgi:hypothetical protein